MKFSIFLIAAVLCLSSLSFAGNDHPDWATDQMLQSIKTIGIDPSGDVEDRGNYHWRYRAKKQLVSGSYTCPAGSAVDISRTISVIIPPIGSPCTNKSGSTATYLKLLSDGIIEPLTQ